MVYGPCHQFHIVDGSAPMTEAGGSFDEVRTRFFGKYASRYLLLVGE